MDKARVYARRELPGFEHLRARFEQYRYARHAHAGVVIGLVDRGVQSYTYRGERHRTGPDGIFFVNAGEAHTGEPADGNGYSYRGIQLDESFIANAFRGTSIRRLAFKDAVVRSPRLARQLRTALTAIEGGEQALRCEELILRSLCAIAQRHAFGWADKDVGSASRRSINSVLDFIAESRMEDLSLSALARLAGMSVFHFAHAFRQQVGCSPFIYAEAIRIERAKSRLRAGGSLAEIAFDLGYTDQSHFTRRFKQHQGTTPGQYRLCASSSGN
jgi:AraC-like DNA-binding protein